MAGRGEVAAPAFDGTVAYFLDAMHQVHALDGETGAPRWVTIIDTTPGETYGVAGCITAGEIVACGDEDIIAVRRSDGTVAWRYHATVGYSAGFFSPTTDGSTIYAGSPSGTLYAIDAATGLARWVNRPFPTATELISIFDPVTDGDIVVAGFTRFLTPRIGGVIALDAANGQTRWIATFPPSPTPSDGTFDRHTALWQNTVIAPSSSGTIYAFDRRSGAILWSLPEVGNHPRTGRPVTNDFREVTVVENALYAASLSGWFIAYDLISRTEKWRVDANVGSSSGGRIVAARGAVYVLSASGDLVAYSATAPMVLWKTGGIEDQFLGSVGVGPDRIFVSRQSGFYAVR